MGLGIHVSSIFFSNLQDSVHIYKTFHRHELGFMNPATLIIDFDLVNSW